MTVPPSEWPPSVAQWADSECETHTGPGLRDNLSPVVLTVLEALWQRPETMPASAQ
jgi:hypothetical protein